MGYVVSDENTIRRGKPHNFTRAILSTAVISMIPLTGKATVALEKKKHFSLYCIVDANLVKLQQAS